MVTIFGYHGLLTASELRRWLRKQGCSFVEESRHPSKDIKKGTLRSILRDLGLKI